MEPDVNMDREQYKQYHEHFMTNQVGTSALDVFLTVAPNIFTPCLADALLGSGRVRPGGVAATCLEFLVILLPMVLTTTVFAEHRYPWLAAALGLYALSVRARARAKAGAGAAAAFTALCDTSVDRRRRWECISRCRALTALLTASCILAVDFPAFPRYFAKTERFGRSLMDAGVGLFVFCNAIVPTKVSRRSVLTSIEMNAKPCFVLAALGLARIAAVRGADYHQHVTEYGTHWNFFLTLAVTKLVCTVAMAVFGEQNSFPCGACALLVHELLLQKGLMGWALSNVGRYGFVASNREGLVSCLGYVALYLMSVRAGRVVRDKAKGVREKHVILSLGVMAVLFWVLAFVADFLFSTCRSLANTGYCFFVLAIGVSVLTIAYLMELLDLSLENKRKPPKRTGSVIYSAVNKNGLLFFTLANIFTGIVNVCVRTLFASNLFAVVVIFLYLVIVCAIVMFMEEKN